MTKKEALDLFSNTLNDFWGETPTPNLKYSKNKGSLGRLSGLFER